MQVLPVGAGAPAVARAAIRDELAAVAPSVVGDAELLASELVTNAVRHAGLCAQDSVSLRIDLLPETVRVGVSDHGPGFERRARPRDRNGGWGLFIVDAVSDRWGVIRGHSNEVWFEIDLEPGSTGSR
jgi:serine/threonine-protein kinase RsbW